jgi:polysaccharide deacetylase family protein (PEP-CTERM system associated)
LNLLGIDFEDWFHPELIQKKLTNEEKKPKVIKGIDKIIDWLNHHETYATFFVVGELLEYEPEIFDKIIENGHEIGFHTMYHTRLDTKNFREKFEEEIKIFDKITSGKSKGFRAPTFSLNESSKWLIDVLEENRYEYDSSVVPAKTSMYGLPNAEIKPYKISSESLESEDPKGKIIEFPILTTKFLGKKIPVGGGFYVRTLPQKIITDAIKKNERNNIPGVFYIHSWELTPEYMPRIKLSLKDNFITYHNIEKTLSKMTKILENFEFTSFNRYDFKKLK